MNSITRCLTCAALLLGLLSACAARAGEAKEDDPFDNFFKKKDQTAPAKPDEDAAAKEKAAAEAAVKEKAAAEAAAKEKAAKDKAKSEPAEPDPFDKFAKKGEGTKTPGAASTNPNAPKSTTPAKPAEPCPLCRNLGILPNLPYKNFVRTDGVPADAPPPWHWCDRCQRGSDPRELAQKMKVFLDNSTEKHKKYEEAYGRKFTLVQTPYAAIHSNLPPKDLAVVATALEDLSGKIAKNSKSMVLLASRTDEHNLIFMADNKSYGDMLDKLFANVPADQREKAKKSPGFGNANEQLMDMSVGGLAANPAALKAKAAFTVGVMLIQSATLGAGGPWLQEGFRCYCENEATGYNTLSNVAPVNNEKLGKLWAEDMKKRVKDNKASTWSEIFAITDLKAMKLGEYQQSWSMVTYLIKMDPARFDKVVLAIRDGETATNAIEKTYGKKLTEMQAYWAAWVSAGSK